MITGDLMGFKGNPWTLMDLYNWIYLYIYMCVCVCVFSWIPSGHEKQLAMSCLGCFLDELYSHSG